jgi:DNA-binding CsgD family transcriptional regulator/PAS domain-containing protein
MAILANAVTVDVNQLVSLVGDIYAAVADAALWPAVLERIAGLLACDGTVLFTNYTGVVAKDIYAVAPEGSSEWWASYQEHYASVNVWTERCDQMFPTGTVRYSHRAISDRELVKTEYYCDWLKPNGLAYGAGVQIALPKQPSALLSCIRSPRRGPFGEEEGIVLESLLPHLQRALELHLEMARLRSVAQGLEHALDAFDRAIVGLDAKGKTLFCNRTARELLAEGDGLQVKNNGRIVADNPAQDAQLRFLLRGAADAGTGFSEGGAILIDRRSGRQALQLTLLPFARNVFNYIPGLATLVFIHDPARKSLSRKEVLRALFRLSPMEARLSDLLASGTELAAAAGQLRMTVETARFHLKSIFRKTGVNRQTDLARLVLALPGHQPANGVVTR